MQHFSAILCIKQTSWLVAVLALVVLAPFFGSTASSPVAAAADLRLRHPNAPVYEPLVKGATAADPALVELAVARMQVRERDELARRTLARRDLQTHLQKCPGKLHACTLPSGSFECRKCELSLPLPLHAGKVLLAPSWGPTVSWRHQVLTCVVFGCLGSDILQSM